MGYLDQPRRFAIFGGGRRATDRQQAEPGEAAHEPADWTRNARQNLLDQISGFLLENELDVTPAMLVVAHSVFGGSNRALAAQIAERQISGKPINQQWLESLEPDRPVRPPPDSQREQLDSMMDQLEQSIHSFAKTTKTAHDQTGQCQSEFADQIDNAQRSLGKLDQTQFLHITKAMLGTLQRIETSMQKSHAETEDLRGKLHKARQEADLDHLTGLPNRRAFERRFNAFHQEADARGTGLFVAICDVDHFKRVNDTFGHEMGDRLLRAIAGILNQYASRDCFVARHGGEEFALLMRCDNMKEAHQRLDQARQKLERRKFLDRESKAPIGQVTFSAGLADVMAADDPREALALADQALYKAKNEGRNRIITP